LSKHSIKAMLAKAGMLLADITDAPQYEAERLLSFILKKPRTFLRAWPDHLLLEDQVNAFFALISRRQQGEPLAYIVGQKDFYDISLVISNAVLVPRPETELLVDTILSLPISQTAIQFADLGTGSGAIALSIAKARPYWQVHAVDISPEALAVAKQNADSLELSHVSFHQGSYRHFPGVISLSLPAIHLIFLKSNGLTLLLVCNMSRGLR
jgi:release factor glutamine methyltransferase